MGKKKKEKTLTASILLTLGVFSVTQFVFFAIVSALYSFPPRIDVWFYVTQVIFHTVLAAFLMLMLPFFYNAETQERLKALNLANRITLFRLSMLPTVLFLILASKSITSVGKLLIPIIALTFVTDMIDGYISRKRHEITQIGKIIDSVSDYSLLIVVAVAYYAFNLLPAWLFAIILFRLFFQAFGMLAVLIARRSVEPKPTIMGKVAIATTMTLFAAEALKLAVPVAFLRWFVYLEYLAAAIIILSVLDKGVFFARQVKRRGGGVSEMSSDDGQTQDAASSTSKAPVDTAGPGSEVPGRE